jgi:hypothetical protein
MAWSPPARQRRSWLVEQAGDYVTQISYQTRDGTRWTFSRLLEQIDAALAPGWEGGAKG